VARKRHGRRSDHGREQHSPGPHGCLQLRFDPVFRLGRREGNQSRSRSGHQVGLDRPLTSDDPYFAPLPEPEPLPEPDEPLLPEPDEPLPLEPDEPLLPEPLLPDVPELPEPEVCEFWLPQLFFVQFESVGFRFLQAAEVEPFDEDELLLVSIEPVDDEPVEPEPDSEPELELEPGP